MLDSKALAKIKSLELRAKVVVEGFWSGIHRSPHSGLSVEFSEYRQYVPGDDPRHVDWRVFARSDRYFIKKFEDETNLRCQLIVDRSRSMRFGAGPMNKEDYAASLAATLAFFLHQQGDATGVMTFAEGVEEYLPPRRRPGHLRRLMISLEQKPSGRGTNLLEPLERIAGIQRRRGLFVLISDFLSPLDLLGERLGLLRARGHEVMVFQVLDPVEFGLEGFEAPGRFVDLETGGDVLIDPSVARIDYQRRFDGHLAAVEKLCDRRGIGYCRMRTDEPLELALHRFLAARSRTARGKWRSGRKQGAGAS